MYWSEEPKYAGLMKSDYEAAGILPITPMAAHEIEYDSVGSWLKENPGSIVEEKLDGCRATVHFFNYGARVFSRFVSKKTGWFTENSDLVPQIRDIVIPALSGTIIDGELIVPGKSFKQVSGTLNCKPEKAIAKQKEHGLFVLMAFDIVYFRGRYIGDLPLWIRKKYLAIVCGVLNRKYKSVFFMPFVWYGVKEQVDTLWETGGVEGAMLKKLSGKYIPDRSYDMVKVKKALTRECICWGFSPPTIEHTGGKTDLKDWKWWAFKHSEGRYLISQKSPNGDDKQCENLLAEGYVPVTKNFWNGWVGNVLLGVVLTPIEYGMLLKANPGKKYEIENVRGDLILLHIGECSGLDELERIMISKNQDAYYMRTVEVECNLIFEDTGKMRHPRFLRWRDDKPWQECTFSDHIR